MNFETNSWLASLKVSKLKKAVIAYFEANRIHLVLLTPDCNVWLGGIDSWRQPSIGSEIKDHFGVQGLLSPLAQELALHEHSCSKRITIEGFASSFGSKAKWRIIFSAE